MPSPALFSALTSSPLTVPTSSEAPLSSWCSQPSPCWHIEVETVTRASLSIEHGVTCPCEPFFLLSHSRFLTAFMLVIWLDGQGGRRTLNRTFDLNEWITTGVWGACMCKVQSSQALKCTSTQNSTEHSINLEPWQDGHVEVLTPSLWFLEQHHPAGHRSGRGEREFPDSIVRTQTHTSPTPFHFLIKRRIEGPEGDPMPLLLFAWNLSPKISRFLLIIFTTLWITSIPYTKQLRKYLLRAYYIPSITLGVGGYRTKKTKILILWSLHCSEGSRQRHAI